MKSLMRNLWFASFAVWLFLPTGASALVTFSAAGADAADIQNTVDAYRAALGGPNNGNAAGPLATGRREINWDGGDPSVVDGTAPTTPFVVFQNTRGATFTTPGTGLTQAAATGGLLSLDLINPTYASIFAPFSPNRLFTPVGSNVTDGEFSIPGTGGTLLAGVRGFGAVFSDVDLPGTSIGYFDQLGDLIGVFAVPATTGDQTFSFLGILLDPDEGLISRIRITTGTSVLGPNESLTQNIDLVVMDDFLYAEPQRIPEPQVLLLLISALAIMFAMSWSGSRRRRSVPR